MPKVRILVGDDAGVVGYMGYPEMQEALRSNPEALEILDGNVENENPDLRREGNLADALERGEVRRSPVAARDLSEDVDPTVVRTLGHGVAGADALRVGESVTHTSEPVPVFSAGAKGPDGVDPLEEVRRTSQERADEQNQRAEATRESATKAAASREGEAAAGAPSPAEPGPSDTSPEASAEAPASEETHRRGPGRPRKE